MLEGKELGNDNDKFEDENPRVRNYSPKTPAGEKSIKVVIITAQWR